ncbi:hypothetical protein GALL_510720 [mine drainage metagenome]|uniref:Uncharacterized protein n=1 Tax=mine drainage metagenome TaxID=410659 RepID=A0A1J5PII4_9ZZZZ
MAQYGVVEFEAMLQFIESFLIAFNVHQHVMCLMNLLDRISHLATTPVFQTVDLAVVAGDLVAVTLDHRGHLLALIRVYDKHDFIMTHAKLLLVKALRA